MLTINAILKEIKEIPVDKLEEVYACVHSFTPPPAKQAERVRKKILSFGGCFGDMSKRDYDSFIKHTKTTRADLFDRNIDV